eukprot:327587_1
MALFSVLIILLIDFVIGFDYYGGSVGPKSVQYSVKLINNGKTYIPHVYGIHAPSVDTNSKNDNSSNNWIEFEQKIDETTTIIIDRLIGKWPSNTHIRPISYGINIILSNSNKTVSFNVTGNALHFSVHYGNEDNDNDPNGCIQSSMLVFITPPNIIPTNNISSNTKIFKPKIYNLTDGGYTPGTGVFAVNDTTNSNVDMIIIERGAFVYGKIFVNKSNVNIYGPGIICGKYFSRNKRHNCTFWNECNAMISTFGTQLNVIGITIITPNFRMFDSINGIIQYYRAIGWMGNNGEGRLMKGSIQSDCFIKTDDDNVKFQENVTTKNMVIWHGYNGAAFQFGNSANYQMPVLNYNWTIIGSENSVPNKYNGLNTTHLSNAIISLPSYNHSKINGPIEFHNLIVDGNARNLILIQAAGQGYVRNIKFYNLLIRGKMLFFNEINAQGTNTNVSNIEFHNFMINDKQIMNINDTELKMYSEGNVDINSIKFYEN